jgi:hypothetical protein
MSSRLTHCNENKLFQELPHGEFVGKINLRKQELLKKLENEKGQDKVYAYIVDTLRLSDHGSNSLVQTGCGPNFQGGAITLTTCKYWMRTWGKVEDWKKDVWIAGFTPGRLFENKDNFLFYLMKVADSFESHKSLWIYLKENQPRTAIAKNARYHRFGDLFEPKPSQNDFGFSSYFKPCEEHVHGKKNNKGSERWHLDVDKCHGKPHALLLGDREKSYIWFDCMIRYRERRHPRTKKWLLADLKSELEDLL